jgi:ABC-type transport system substrate-binding protein
MGEAIRDAMWMVGSSGVSRRQVVRALAALGMTAPVISALLDGAPVARAGPGGVAPNAWPRGGGGPLRLLFWQAPTILNSHLSVSGKDANAAGIFYEPLAAFDADARLVSVLAAGVPSRENGQVAPDGLSVVWNLKRGVRWHDGRPFTADDVVFTREYAIEGGVAGRYRDLERVERLGDHAVRVMFREPTAVPPTATRGSMRTSRCTTSGRPGSAPVHGALHVVADPEQGDQLERKQRHALARRWLRRALAGGPERAGPRQTRGALHPNG